MKSKITFFRPEIEKMKGYEPGEQPQDKNYVKLNTNENPYPPSPRVAEVLKSVDYERLRLYPDPLGCELRRTIASLHGLEEDNVLLGNGSDDILTMLARSFVGKGDKMACMNPSYSLYPALAEIQGAKCVEIPLNEQDNFSLPDNFLDLASTSKIFIMCRPNAPTGTVLPRETVRKLCENFKGIVFIDEAYADFAEDNCLDFVKEFKNTIIGRTLSKSYSLAGLRLGYAIASKQLITGILKVKDSYNVNFLTQKIAMTALQDRNYFRQTIMKIKEGRRMLIQALREKNFKVADSQANFVFASPKDGKAEELYKYLKSKGVLVRYFPFPETKNYVRITVGAGNEMKKLLELL